MSEEDVGVEGVDEGVMIATRKSGCALRVGGICESARVIIFRILGAVGE